MELPLLCALAVRTFPGPERARLVTRGMLLLELSQRDAPAAANEETERAAYWQVVAQAQAITPGNRPDVPLVAPSDEAPLPQPIAALPLWRRLALRFSLRE